MPDSIATSLSANPDANETISSITAALQDKFTNSNAKNQLLMLPDLVAAGSSGVEVLINWLGKEDLAQPTVVAGAVYQALYHSEIAGARDYLDRQFPTGIIALNSVANIDYTRLQQLLAQQEFQAADKLTTEKLCELAGAGAVSRKWIYFTEVEQLPIEDLQTIDKLWLIHSQGQFGFSIQRNLWVGMGKNWDKLWVKIGWKSGNNWTRYPGSFTWNLTAPKGHLPLSNQLRGVRVISSLLSHPAWE